MNGLVCPRIVGVDQGGKTVNYVFIICAAIGGTILVIQFVMTLIGLGGHAFDIDVSTDVGHDFGGFGGDVHVDTGGDFHVDSGGDVHVDHAGGDTDHAHQSIHHGSTWLFGILSFRTIIAALAFFGLGGLAAQSAQVSMPNMMLISIAAGAAAMFAVYWMMRGLQAVQAEGTVRLQRAVGQHGNVYLRVPASRAGSGKVQFNLQNRTMEYLAITSGPELPTGTKVVVVGVVNPTTLEVQADEHQGESQ
jgi:hypothetical protein